MHPLFDFGISQEDPMTELKVLDIRDNDRLLCVGSGGEVPLTLLSLHPGIKITAVDISRTQLALCRLKMLAAIALPFPLNGQFIGYAHAEPKIRREIYFDLIHPELMKADQDFWMLHLPDIENGVLRSGRFEGYIERLRKMITIIIGQKNLVKLLDCSDTTRQEYVFDKYIGGRKAVKYLFHIAFHPLIYKNRGLNSKGLMHARTNTGEIFFNKFRNFCVATPIQNNYFLQYFLAGSCTSVEAFPEYCHEKNRAVLKANQLSMSFVHSTLQEALMENKPGSFNKVHLSNIGDWMSQDEFNNFGDILCNTCQDNTILCYRFLQKNHLENNKRLNGRFDVAGVHVENTDRFPFYSILSLHAHG